MRLTRWSIVIAVLNIAVYSPGILSAGVIASASATWTGFTCPYDETTQACSGPTTPVGDSTSTTGTNVSASVSGGAHGTAVATYGYVSAYAGANSGLIAGYFHGFRITSAYASASASFDDFITIYGGTGEGTVEGAGTFHCCRYYDATGSAVFTLGAASASASPYYPNGAPFDLLTTFTFGVPFQIRGSANEFAEDFVPWDSNQGAADGLASFSVSSLIVRDANGQPLTGYTYSTASESRYALQDGSFVPEPGTGTTLLLVLFPGFVYLRRLISMRVSINDTSAR